MNERSRFEELISTTGMIMMAAEVFLIVKGDVMKTKLELLIYGGGLQNVIDCHLLKLKNKLCKGSAVDVKVVATACKVSADATKLRQIFCIFFLTNDLIFKENT